jgi:galactokinase
MSDFQTLFSRPPEVTADAPGRVNLIGEHTDYNGGFVLPMAIPQRTRVELAKRDDRVVRVWSGAQDQVGTFTLGAEQLRHDWLDYIQGVTSRLQKAGFSFQGFDARIESNVPLGSGLSSSAALSVSLMRALRAAFQLSFDDVQIAQIGQRAENEFVGARVGIMDPMAASLADEGTALFLDARSLEFRRVPLPRESELIVIHSGVSHRLTSGDYNTRRGECERACELLGIGQLRDFTLADLPLIESLPEPLNRRARHVVSENQRVLDAVSAMKAGDARRLGTLFYDSHASMRDDYQVSVPEIDLLVEIARAKPAILGARLTGGGFGGSVVMLAVHGQAANVAGRIAEVYAVQSGCTPNILVPPV